MKKYTVSINFAQTNGLPCNLVDIEFNGDVIDSEFVESNFAELEKCLAEMQASDGE